MKLKIAFDLHGVLDKYPAYLKPMLRMFWKMDIEVCVVSGPPEDKIYEELSKAGYDSFDFTDVYSVVDFLMDNGVDFNMTDPDNPWCDDNMWWDSKARICRDYDIDLLIDDSEKYRPAFDLIDAGFIHVDEIVVKCK